MPVSWPDPLPGGSYLLLTTFRKDGRAVPTPVWFGLGDHPGELLAFSGEGAGKSKRLRHTSRVLVQGCTVRGKPLGPPAAAQAELVLGEQAWELRRRVGRSHRVPYALWSLYFRNFVKDEWNNPVGIRITDPVPAPPG